MEVLHENQDLDFKPGFGVECLPPPVKNEVAGTPNFGVKADNGEIWGADVSNGDGDPSLFYAADDFPPLPEFPCMSSSSSTSSTPVPSSATTAPPGGFSSGATSTSSSSSSSAASWAMLKSDNEVEDDLRHHHRHHQQQLEQQLEDCGNYDGMDGLDCMNVMEDFDCMGINQLIEDSNEIWDPTPLFESTDPPPEDPIPQPQLTNYNPFDPHQFDQQQPPHDPHLGDDPFSQSHHHHHPFMFLDPPGSAATDHCNQSLSAEDPEPNASCLSEDLAVVFFEWLKSNKESISAEELRSIKIKKSTIESAARRLGGGKQGMKQLLKLILQWVQNHRLQNKQRSQASFDFTQQQLPNPIQQEPLPAACYIPPPPPQQQPWIPPYVTDPGGGVAIAPAPSSFTSYIGGGGGGGGGHHNPYGVPHHHHHHQPYHVPPPPPDQYHMLDGSMTSWTGQVVPPPPQFPPAPMHYNASPDGISTFVHTMAPHGYPSGGYSNGYNPHPMFSGPGDGLLRMGSTSATKEARKKRMARQRRAFTHHHHRNTQHNPNHPQQMIQGGFVDHDSSGSAAHGGWMYWPPAAGGPMVTGQPMMGSIQPHQQQPAVSDRSTAVMPQGSQRQAANSDKKQGFKTEKNLKFLLQKVLKQSDVGNLGRIVLPKKEAETHLPELEARDGIPIAMEDISTSRVWNMRYRFWPNNKSRMYLLENTGDFVRSNGLQEGDFIVIYSDVKCGKYMIRGVKVRPQQQGSKPELAKKPPLKALKTQNSASPSSSGLSPLTHRQLGSC